MIVRFCDSILDWEFGQTLKQILDKFTKGTFHSLSTKVIWPPKKIKFHAMVGPVSAALCIGKFI